MDKKKNCRIDCLRKNLIEIIDFSQIKMRKRSY